MKSTLTLIFAFWFSAISFGQQALDEMPPVLIPFNTFMEDGSLNWEKFTFDAVFGFHDLQLTEEQQVSLYSKIIDVRSQINEAAKSAHEAGANANANAIDADLIRSLHQNAAREIESELVATLTESQRQLAEREVVRFILKNNEEFDTSIFNKLKLKLTKSQIESAEASLKELRTKLAKRILRLRELQWKEFLNELSSTMKREVRKIDVGSCSPKMNLENVLAEGIEELDLAVSGKRKEECETLVKEHDKVLATKIRELSRKHWADCVASLPDHVSARIEKRIALKGK